MTENRRASTSSCTAGRSGCSRATGFATTRRPRTPRRPNGCLRTRPDRVCSRRPNPSNTGAWNAGQFQLEVFARGNNANHWAGEVDVFESTAAVQRRFTIDDSRLVLRGFSLGGAGAWHLALHHPDRWVAAEIGAGTWPRRYLMMKEFPAHQQPTLRIWENMTEWALNAFNIPIAGA